MELHSPMAACAKAGTMGTIGRGNGTAQPHGSLCRSRMEGMDD